MTEDRGQRTEDGGRRTEDGGQRTVSSKAVRKKKNFAALRLCVRKWRNNHELLDTIIRD